MQVSIVFLVRIQCRRKESSRSNLISWWVSCFLARARSRLATSGALCSACISAHVRKLCFAVGEDRGLGRLRTEKSQYRVYEITTTSKLQLVQRQNQKESCSLMSSHDHKLVFHRSEFDEVAALLQLLVVCWFVKSSKLLGFQNKQRWQLTARCGLLLLGKNKRYFLKVKYVTGSCLLFTFCLNEARGQGRLSKRGV